MGTKYRGSREEVRALNAYITLTRSAETVSNAVNRHLRERGMTLRQFAVIEALYHLGPLAQCDIAEKMLCTAGNITGVIDKLEEERLVRRQGCEEDRRANVVTLTAKGRGLVEEILPEHVAGVAKAFQSLPVKDQEELRRICRALGRGI